MKRKCTALLNGKVITIDKNDTIAQAILISGEKIVAVGSNEQIQELSAFYSEANVVDLGGKSVIPGFVDSHTHLELSLNHFNKTLNLHNPLPESLEQIFHALEEYVRSKAKGEWIIARGPLGIEYKVREGRIPTLQELDRVAPENPLVLFSGLHRCHLNTLAIEALGWIHETRLPNGASLGRDSSTGEMTGVFTEVWDHIPNLASYEELLSMLKKDTISQYVSRGGTSIHEIPYSIEGIKAWQELYKNNELSIRVKLYLHHPHMHVDQLLNTGLQSGFGNEWVSIGGIKYFADGSSFHGNLHPVQDLMFTQDEMDELVYKAHQAGLQIWTHVLTRKGTEMALTAYERALERLPKADHRHRLEHTGDRYNEEVIQRMQRAGIIPISSPQFLYYVPQRDANPRLRTLIEQGFMLPGNTDNGGSMTNDPWHSIWCCVQRETQKGTIWTEEERITPLQAIRMFTLWAAWGGFEDQIKGSIEPGKLADLVITSEDPLTVDPDALRTMPVDLVLVGGEVKWSSSAFAGVTIN